MKRRNFYDKISNELLGCFYCYIQDKIEQGVHLKTMNFENHLIEEVAKKRGISLIELRIIGYWFIQKEKNLTKDNVNRPKK
ncbi:hypothetical protein SAMN05216389_11057 [Oceanobacillus limi]|uniref:Uncharacterized protein n=1 Tax=Oceanobacillus limi TaxID=930131 RepID=A0A1I0E198_9BACI|nr:hypothetical protein [Oceanobacillus limi]SET38708.1 hypothetical protein SAMN05216389_11057 [Oceanobacillus limi]